uniref:WASH_WAHD domain-containing protein n=1 Tax=Macrostomum lignano TaxID=282301 RepID=A0A1I8JQF5_9PLAT
QSASPAIQCQLSRCRCARHRPICATKELLVQSADSLAEVAGVAEAVFDRLGSRLAEQRAECDRLRPQSRRLPGQDRLLKGTTRAVQVFAVPKFPAGGDSAPAFLSPFAPEGEGAAATAAVGEVQTAVRRVAAQHEALTEALLAEKAALHDAAAAPSRRQRRAAAAEGLGRPPPGLRSLSGLTACWIRSAFVHRVRAVQSDDSSGGGGATPGQGADSILLGDRLEAPGADSCCTCPPLAPCPRHGEPAGPPAPAGRVVAENVQYLGDLGPGIAPSAADNILSSLGDLPSAPPPPPASAAASEPALLRLLRPLRPLRPLHRLRLRLPLACRRLPLRRPSASPPPSSATAPPPPPPGAICLAPWRRRTRLAPVCWTPIRQAGGAGKAKLKSVKERKLERKRRIRDDRETADAGADEWWGARRWRSGGRRHGHDGRRHRGGGGGGGGGSGGNGNGGGSGGTGNSMFDTVSAMIAQGGAETAAGDGSDALIIHGRVPGPPGWPSRLLRPERTGQPQQHRDPWRPGAQAGGRASRPVRGASSCRFAEDWEGAKLERKRYKRRNRDDRETADAGGRQIGGGAAVAGAESRRME